MVRVEKGLFFCETLMIASQHGWYENCFTTMMLEYLKRLSKRMKKRLRHWAQNIGKYMIGTIHWRRWEWQDHNITKIFYAIVNAI